MGHPVMFDASDPLLQRVRESALALPGAREKVSHGQPATKVFAYYGGSREVEELLEDSFRRTAGRRLTGELDAR